MITTRKIKVVIIADDAQERNSNYDFVRNETRLQNNALNAAMNHLYFNYVAKDKIKLADETYLSKEKEYSEYINRKYSELKSANTDKQKELIRKSIKDKETKLAQMRTALNKQSSEMFKEIIATSEQTNLRDLISSKYELLSDTKDRLTQKVTQDFGNDIKDILSGKRVLRRYKKDNPLYVRGRALKFYCDQDEYYIKWTRGIVFKCLLGVKKQNSIELQTVLHKIINEEYKISDSSISFKDKNLILNLSVNIPDKKYIEFIPDRVVGVDLGMKIPAYCTLNDNDYIKQSLGSIDDFLKVKLQMQSRKRKLQTALKSAKGGKGRDKKLSALDRFSEKERNFNKTYNHFLSSNIIQFALKNKAGQINLELLSMDVHKNKSILRNWCYYQLQQFVEYKAEREGIKVLYIDPYHTSQTCSKCGHFEEGQREKQAVFICKNCGFETNADYNASRNIAKSIKYITDKKESEYYKKHDEINIK